MLKWGGRVLGPVRYLYKDETDSSANTDNLVMLAQKHKLVFPGNIS